MYVFMYIYIYIYIHIYIYVHTSTLVSPLQDPREGTSPKSTGTGRYSIYPATKKSSPLVVISRVTLPGDYDDDYLRLQHGKEFHNFVYKSYVKHINSAKRHR
jgi:hypothetical protein